MSKQLDLYKAAFDLCRIAIKTLKEPAHQVLQQQQTQRTLFRTGVKVLSNIISRDPYVHSLLLKLPKQRRRGGAGGGAGAERRGRGDATRQ